MSSLALFGISVALSFTAWGAVASYYLWPALRQRSAEEALKAILLLHGFRFVGLAFAIPGVVSAELPAAFALPAAYGDLAAAVLALAAFGALRTRAGTALTWVFNIFGAADLLLAFYQGSRTGLADTPGLLGSCYFLVTAAVPLLLITHGLAIRILLQSRVPAPAQAKFSAA